GGRFGRDLIIKADVSQVKRNVLFGMPIYRFLKLLAGHRRKNDILDDHGIAADACDDVVGIDAMIHAKIANDVRDGVHLHDLTIDDRVARQVFKSEIYQAQAIRFSFQFDHLYRTRADIKTGDAFLLTEQHLLLLLRLNIWRFSRG